MTAVREKKRWRIAALLATAFFSSPAKAIDFILPGMEAKASGGAGQTVSRGGSALFFNPANVLLSQGIQSEADVSLVNATYSYQNADTETYEPAVLGVTTPATSLGMAWRINTASAIGFEFLPLGLGSAQNYYGAPVEIIPDTFQAMDITRKDVSLRLAIGGAYRILDKLTAGGSMIVAIERSSLRLKNAGTDRNAIEASYSGQSFQPALGLRADVGHGIVIAGSYRLAVTRAYHGTLAINSASLGSPEAFQSGDFAGKAYDPAVFGLGAEWRHRSFGFFGDFSHKFWSAGRGISSSGLGSASSETDLVDTNDFVVGGKYWFGGYHILQAAFGTNGANIGDGDIKDSATNTRNTSGVQLGQTEAIARLIVSGGYGYKLSPGRQIQAAAMILNGKRDVPAGYSQAGSFKLQAFIVSVGASLAF